MKFCIFGENPGLIPRFNDANRAITCRIAQQVGMRRDQRFRTEGFFISINRDPMFVVGMSFAHDYQSKRAHNNRRLTVKSAANLRFYYSHRLCIARGHGCRAESCVGRSVEGARKHRKTARSPRAGIVHAQSQAQAAGAGARGDAGRRLRVREGMNVEHSTLNFQH